MSSGQELKDHYGKRPPLKRKTMKGDYNNSSHQSIFVSLLTGKSAKAFQSLQNESGHNPNLLLHSSGLMVFISE